MKPAPQQLVEDFEAALTGQADSDVAGVVHAMFEDVIDSFVLAMRSTLPQEQIDGIVETVQDYIGNHYGDM